jgi:hypothetical protein
VLLVCCLTSGPPFPSRGSISLDPVTRVREEDLDIQTFVEKYAKPGIPVVIEMTQKPFWNWTAMNEECGDQKISLISPATAHGLLGLGTDMLHVLSWVVLLFGKWISLETEVRSRALDFRLRDYIALLHNPSATSSSCDPNSYTQPYILRFLPTEVRFIYDFISRPLYMHDLPISDVCPDMAKYSHIPASKFVGTNAAIIAQRKKLPIPQEFARNPFIFAGPCHSQSYPLHQNIFQADVMMVMVEGEKRFAVFAPDQSKFLHPVFLGQAPVFDADAFDPDLHRTPLIDRASGFEGSLKAGDILFLPGSWIHQFQNCAVGPSTGLKIWYAHPETDLERVKWTTWD